MFVLGLRIIARTRLIVVAALTISIPLASVPTAGEAAFSAEAVVPVIVLILFLTLAIDRSMEKIPACGHKGGSGPSAPPLGRVAALSRCEQLRPELVHPRHTDRCPSRSGEIEP